MPSSPKEFREFSQMAKTWMQAALQLERSLALIDDDLRRPRVPRLVLRPAK